MVRKELFEVLSILHQAGGHKVPAEDLRWTTDMFPALNLALAMHYMKRQETRWGVVFSLTRAGYEALGEQWPADISLRGMFGLILGLFRKNGSGGGI